MRRKSKKVKEEAKESGSERRSKRSSTRRKRAYEDDEGGSGVEEERTTEEEMTPTTPTKSKDRGGRRYATRGRRQKPEESEEEEVSQAEEERVDYEEESSNNLPGGADADDRENEISDRADDSKGLKSGVVIPDKSVVSEGNDGASTWKSDKQFWEMKSNKSDQDDKCGGIAEETPAQGEVDDGEEEGSRTHSRKRKLKLSRECLQENREAIPKIRLRLSRNRSGGYETEKLEAERIETKKADEETIVKVIKVENVIEGKEAVDNEKSVSCEPTETVEPDKGNSEAAQQGSKEAEDIKAEVTEVEKEDVQEEMEREASPKIEENSEPSDSQVCEEEVKKEIKIEEIRTNEDVESSVCGDASAVEVVSVVELPNDQAEERTEQVINVNTEAKDSVHVEESEVTSASPDIKKDMEDETEQDAERPEPPNETRDREEERRVTEESQNKQVSGEGEVSDQMIKEESREGNSEKPKDDEKEGSDAEEEPKAASEEVVEENESVEVGDVAVKRVNEEVGSASKDEDYSKDAETLDNEGKPQEEGGSEHIRVHGDREEQDHKSGSGERASRINRSKLRQDDDAGEELQNQKRRRRRRSRSRESSSSENRRLSTTSVTSDQPQPKRVSLKRPKLIRSSSTTPMNVSTSPDEKESKEEPVVEKVENKDEEEKQSEVIAEETEHIATIEENKSLEQSATTEEVIKKRRRKWGQQKSQGGPSQSKRAFISISTQSLKGLIPEVKPLPIHELRLSVEKDDTKDICMEEEESCEASVDETLVRMIDANGQNERTIWAQVVDEEMRTTIHPEAPRVPHLGGGDAAASAGPVRRISIVSDDATRLQRSPSPPRNPPSSVLFLSNLVRPFTVQQLKELLARTGTVVEDGFWIDRIKSMCLVQYETEDQARETRHALHGVRWPISNPKRLWVDFATKERLEEAKREGNVPPPAPATGPSLTPPHPAPRDDFPRKTEPLRVDGSGMVPIHHAAHRGTPGSPGRQGHAVVLQQGPIISAGPVAEGATTDNVAWQQRGRPRPDAPPLRPGANARDFKLSAPIREWDLDKVVQQSPPRPGIHGPSRGPVDDRRRPEAAGQPGGRRDRILPSPPPFLQEMQARKAKRKEAEAAAAAEAPANLLDSLFRKTKTTPSIYWLPLTAEQIKVKEEIRRQHLAEHERRMAEMKRAAEKERGGRRRRRSSSPRRRSRRRSGEGSSAVRKKPSESMKGHKAGSASPKK